MGGTRYAERRGIAYKGRGVIHGRRGKEVDPPQSGVSVYIRKKAKKIPGGKKVIAQGTRKGNIGRPG